MTQSLVEIGREKVRDFISKSDNLYLAFVVLIYFIFSVIYFVNGPYLLFQIPVLILILLFVWRSYFVGLLAAILLTIVFEQFFTLLPLEIFGKVYKIYPLDLVIIFSSLSFLFKEVIFARKKIIFGKLGKIILLFSCVAVFAFFYGIKTGGSAAIAFSSLKNYVFYALLYFLTINFVKSKEDLQTVIKVLFFASFPLIILLGIGIFRGEGLWVLPESLSTEGSRLIAPEHAFYMGLVLIIVLAYYSAKKRVVNFLTFPVILALFWGLIVSLTRHLWLAFGFSFAFLFCLLPREKKKFLAKISLYSLLVLLTLFTTIFWVESVSEARFDFFSARVLFDNVVERITSINVFKSDDPSGLWRIFVWQKSIELFSASPLWGLGFGKAVTFDFKGYPAYSEIRSLHNGFLGIAIQMGIVGFAIFILMNLKVVIDFFRGLKTTPPKKYFPPLIFFSCYLYFVVSANFGVYLEINLLSIFLWLILGLFELSSKELPNIKTNESSSR